MKRFLIFLVIVGLLGAASWWGFPHAAAYWRARNRPTFRQREVVRGDIVSSVNATGTVQPVLRVSIGSFVSGPVIELHADYNTEVQKGDLLARIDPRIYEANAARDRAALTTRKSEVARIEAMLQQARNDEKRAQALRKENAAYISDAEMDRVYFSRLSLEAELKVAKAAVEQAQANLDTSEANLGYTRITAPVAGKVVDRKIDEGQTLAASFQTPELFILAPNMREKMHIFASVDEADIGLIREAQERKEPVEFTVDAYPNDLFTGTVAQIRINSTTTQNVVTYPVIVEAPNPDLKLLPGMTASISFQIEKQEKILKIPNAALRFYPKPELVRPEDRPILEGTDDESEDTADAEEGAGDPSAADKIAAHRRRDRRHVWVVDGDWLRAVEIHVGLSDNRYTQLVRGKLKAGQKLVTGIDRPTP